MKSLLGFVALLLFASLALAAGSYDEGVEYETLPTAQPTVDDKKIEVLELFWYGCPHCYHLEPEIREWLKHKPDDVVFVRMPAVLGPSWELLARAYYTAELLGVVDKVHTSLFNHIHKERKPLNDVEQIKKVFEEHGVSAADFDNTFNSFAVITKTNRAKQVREMYGVTGVPTLIVNGKYRVTAKSAGGNKEMLQVVDFLVARERPGAEQKTAPATR